MWLKNHLYVDSVLSVHLYEKNIISTLNKSKSFARQHIFSNIFAQFFGRKQMFCETLKWILKLYKLYNNTVSKENVFWVIEKKRQVKTKFLGATQKHLNIILRLSHIYP